jgi:hypothetical protein
MCVAALKSEAALLVLTGTARIVVVMIASPLSAKGPDAATA